MWTVCSSTFQRENNKELTVPRVLFVVAGFVLGCSLSSAEMLSVE
jgi:hypothetical protein